MREVRQRVRVCACVWCVSTLYLSSRTARARPRGAAGAHGGAVAPAAGRGARAHARHGAQVAAHAVKTKKSYTPNGRGCFFDFYVTRGDSRERSSVVYIENPLPLLTIYRFYGSPYMQLRHWSADRLTPGSWSAVSWGAETALAAVTAARMRWDSASPLPMRSRRSSTW